MSDRLKLSDPKGDAEVERVATALEQREDNSRIRQLEQNIAALERELARKKADAGGSVAPAGNNKIGARKHASFKAISTAPSINKTPIGPTMVPIPYPVVQDLSSSVNTARTVKFNGCPVYLLDGSTQPHCTGDEPGTGKGIKSGTVSGEVKPVKGCSTVRVEGKQVVREGDACTMNGGNNPGVYVTTCTPSSAPPKDAIRTSNPSTQNGSTPRKESSFESWNHDDPLGLFSRQTAAEKLAAEMQRNTLGGKSAMTRTTTAHRNASVGPRLTPWDPSAEQARQQRTINSMNIALLGPFGAPGAAARMANKSEQRVADANDVGVAAMGVAWSVTGLPSRQPLEPITTRAPSIVGKAVSNGGTGVKIVAKTTSSPAIDAPKLQTAAERSAAFQGTYPYEGIDTLRNIQLEEGKHIVQITFREDGSPISEYFTTESAIRRATLADGSIDANRLNQGLQIHAGTDPVSGAQRPHFKTFVQFYETTAVIPQGQVAFGKTKANPMLNPDNYQELPQLFINKEYHKFLRPVELKKMVNTETPKYVWPSKGIK